MHKTQRTYTKEFKQEAVHLVHSSKKSQAQIARDLGIAESTLQHWCQLFSEQGEQAFPGSGHQSPQEEEIRHLKRENELLRQERDILKRAMPWRAPPRMNRGIMSGRDPNARTELFA